jgi:hypothetical protein
MIVFFTILIIILAAVVCILNVIAARESVAKEKRSRCQAWGLVATCALVLTLYWAQRTMASRQASNLQGVIDSQASMIDLLKRIPLNRNIMGIEISYVPAKEKWNEIKRAYSKIKSPEADLPYYNAPMIAESEGDHWNIDFEPTEVKGEPIKTPNGDLIPVGGNKKLPKTSTTKNKLFEEVLNEALLGLRIHWGNGTDTMLNQQQNYYPSAMYISRERIKFIIRPPLVLWNLNELKNNAQVTFFGQNYPVDHLPQNFTIRSLDPGVKLEQTIPLDWKDRERQKFPSYDEQVNPRTSGPHKLAVTFEVFDPGSGKPVLPAPQ